jgi:hypothetical protein
MNSFIKKCLVMILLLTLVSIPVQRAEAAKGVPGSPEFGFGLMLHLDGPLLDETIDLVTELNPDWLYVPVSWVDSQADGSAELNVAALDRVIAKAAQYETPVALSIFQAPDWALTPDGPDAQMAADFAALLVQRYPKTVQALEIFPKANTSHAWGSAPDPRSYLALFAAVQDRLKADGSDVLLIAAGLQLFGTDDTDPAVEMDDLAFLQGLYDAGGQERIRVISLQYADLSAKLMDSPFDKQAQVFRHYEMVRATMLANHHAEGLIWITSFSLPSGVYDQDILNSEDLLQQHNWLQQAYYQAHSQIYIGTAVLQSLNPPPAGFAARTAAMVQPGGARHPFYQMLMEMTMENNPDGTLPKLGRAKMGGLLKNRQ